MSVADFAITSHPHRSLGAQGFRALLFFVVTINAVAGTAFALMGAWPVTGFMGLDVVAVYIAFRLSYFQTRAFERICIDERDIIVERCDAKGHLSTWTMPAYWTSVWFDGDETCGDITLRSHGRSVRVGEFLPGFERALFAETLRNALRASRVLNAPSQTQDVLHVE
jgi:uncharacterized membrane protein